ncbi:hypothetical protein ACA910_012668 [Epithemia clementina (nom. ined.)]
MEMNAYNNNINGEAKRLATAAAAAARRRKEQIQSSSEQQAKAQRRIKVGDGKPNVIRDLAIFVGIIGVAVWWSLSSNFDQEKQNRQQQQQQQPQPANNKPYKHPAESFADRINQAFDALLAEKLGPPVPPRTDPCDIFLGTSTIPNAKTSLFAGKLYYPGDVVLEAPPLAFLPVVVESKKKTKRTMTTTTTTTTWSLTKGYSNTLSTHLFVASYALFLKFHPTLDNINSTSTVLTRGGETMNESILFRATKTIQPRDELFLSFHNHPASLLLLRSNNGDDNDDDDDLGHALFRYIPTVNDYQLVDEIRLLVQQHTQFLQATHNAHRKFFHHHNHHSRPNVEEGHLLALGRAVASKFNPVVANLLAPQKYRQYPQEEENPQPKDPVPSHWSVLRNKTMADLRSTSGTCLSDVSWDKSNETTVIRSNRRFEENDIVQVVPIHIVMIRRRSNHSTAAAVDSNHLQNEQQQQVSKNKNNNKNASMTSCVGNASSSTSHEQGEESQQRQHDPKQCHGSVLLYDTNDPSYKVLLSRCWSTPDSLVALCPLSGFAPIAPPHKKNTQNTEFSAPETNVAIRWSTSTTTKRNDPRNLEIETVTMDDIGTNRLSPGFLTLQIVATKPIELGDQLISNEPSSVADELIPRHWRL